MNTRAGAALALLVILATVAAAVSLTEALLHPPARDHAVFAGAMLGSGLATTTLALAGRRFVGTLELRWQIALASAVGLALLVLNVSVSAWLMFLSSHDLKLLIVLCGFALAVTIVPAALASQPLADRVLRVERAAREVASGNLARRAEVAGKDEVASLARAFNEMAATLERHAAERASAEASRRALYAAISHDLRTPLASMQAMVEAISDGVVTDEETVQRYLAGLAGEIKHLTALINDLFELTRIESGELQLRLEWLSLDDVVGQAVESFRPQVERAGVHISFEAGTRGTVQADPERLTRVVYNLLHNALRHTPYDGAIVMRTEPIDPETVRVAITDTGEGIAEADAPYVFDRFFRGDPARMRDGAGAGLGLSIARGIVESHGGSIWLDRTGRGGTTICFTLPASRERSPASAR